MRAATLQEIREVLSSPAALQFFEAWAKAADERARAEEQLEGLATQLSSAEGRVRHAEESARTWAARAEDERRRSLAPVLEAGARPFVQLEAEALSRAMLAKAKAALTEATERRRRTVALAAQASEAERHLVAAREAQAALRGEGAALGGYLGENTLFFYDAEVPGGAFVVPLAALPADPAPLPAFVLHRLAPGASLAAAVAVRDTPSPDAPELSGETLSTEPDEIERTELP